MEVDLKMYQESFPVSFKKYAHKIKFNNPDKEVLINVLGEKKLIK